MPKRTYKKSTRKVVSKGTRKSTRGKKSGKKSRGKKSRGKKSSRRSKRCAKGQVRSFKRLASGKLSKTGECVTKPFGAKKASKDVKEEKKALDKAEAVLDKKEEKLEDAIVAGAPAPVIAELKAEVKEAKEVVEENKGRIPPEFDLAAMGLRIRKRVKGSKRGKKSRGKSRKTSSGKKSRGKKSKKSRGKKSKKHSKRH